MTLLQYLNLNDDRDYFEIRQDVSPFGFKHPPSLKNPQYVPQPFGGADGWHDTDSAMRRAKARQLLDQTMTRTRRQMSNVKPMTRGAHYPARPFQDWS